jgi:hypothetical protein
MFLSSTIVPLPFTAHYLIMQSKRPNDPVKEHNKPNNTDHTPKQSPPEHDDPTSAQDDPELPADEAFIPTQADLEAKESVEYFTPSGEFPDPGAAEDMEPVEEDETPEILPGTDADVTAEDLAALGPAEEDMDVGEDESVRNRDALVKDTDAESDEEPAEQLDVPGAELDNDQEDIGREDEENNEYSLGGDKD